MKRKGIIHSILLRYMISYAAVMAVLFIGVGVYMNNTYTNTVRANTIENNINKLGKIRYQHEANLTTLLSVGRQIGLSPYTRSFKLAENPMRAYHLKLQLLPYTTTIDFFDQFYLLFHEDEYLYSSATSVGLEMFLYKLMLFERTSPEEMRVYLRKQDIGMAILPAQNVSSILTDGVNNSMVAVIVPLSMGDRYTTGNLLFTIKESTYQQMFADEIYEPRSTYIFYEDQTLAASRGLDLSDEAVYAHVEGNQGTLSKDVSLGGRQYLLVAQKGHMYDMQYVTLIPVENMRGVMNSAQLGFGMFLFALSIPCMALTFYFSRRHAKPIRELRYLLSATTPGKDDLEAIQSGIVALVDRNAALNTRLDESLPARKASFIKDFVKGRYQDRQAAVMAAGQMGMHIDKACYAVSLIGTPPKENGGLDMEKAAAQLCGDVVGYYVELLALEQFLFVIFADNADALETWAWRIQGDLAAMDSGVAVSISKVHKEFRHAANAYLEASTAYDNRFVMGSTHVLRFADVSAAAKDITPFTRSYLEGFKKALRAGDARALSDRMDELFHFLGSTELSLFAFRMIYNNVIAAILNEHIDRHGESMDALQYYDVFTLSGCRSIADLDDLLRKLCSDILSKSEPEPVQTPTVIRDIIGYMHQHYADPTLSMSAIADAYGISAVRLSLDFKELSGMTPSEYLLLLRMEKAKELLGGTRMSVKDIGLAVGYYDASGFNRRFRQYMAMTPAQYRQMIGQKDDVSLNTQE